MKSPETRDKERTNSRKYRRLELRYHLASRQKAGAIAMKGYLALTGTLFGAFAAFHVWATVQAFDRLSTEPGLVAGRAAIAIVSGSLALWAWRLFRASATVKQ